MTVTTEPPNGQRRTKPTTLDRVFAVGVVVKGIDGAIELVIGLALLIVPGWIDGLLDWFLGKAQAGGSTVDSTIAAAIGHADSQLATGGMTFLIAFLIVHGLIKLGLVYALLRRIVRAYPWAIGVLIAFLVYQLCALITTPSIGRVCFSLLDVAIIVLVWRDYHELRAAPRSRSSR